MSVPPDVKSDKAASKEAGNCFDPIPEGLSTKGKSASNPRLKDLRITNLHIQTEEGNLDGVKKILEKDKSNLDFQDREGMTALMIAVKNKNKDMVARLLQFGPKLDIQDKAKKTALHWAAQDVRGDMLKQLLSEDDSAKTSGTMSTRKTADNEGASHGTESKVQESSTGSPSIESTSHDEAGRGLVANIDLLDSKGRTPLYLAAESGNFSGVDLLLRRGADDRLPDDRGMIPLDAAAVAGRKDVIKLLKDKWAPGELRDLVPAYYFLQNFVTSPPPQGPLSLGMIITSPTNMSSPLKKENPPPKNLTIHHRQLSGFRVTLAQAKTRQYGPCATSLGTRLIPMLSQAEHDILKVGAVEDRFFIPNPEYLQQSIKSVSETHPLFGPVYIVTGMKIARGVSFIPALATKTGLGLGGDVKANAGIKSKQEESKNPVFKEEFIFAVCLWKLSRRRPFRLYGASRSRYEPYNPGFHYITPQTASDRNSSILSSRRVPEPSDRNEVVNERRRN
ncbi:ankyrin [Daldinia loculata]|nr:ankyrin [Daldinia loculata]